MVARKRRRVFVCDDPEAWVGWREGVPWFVVDPDDGLGVEMPMADAAELARVWLRVQAAQLLSWPTTGGVQ